MKIILTANQIAEKCFLEEALLWAGFYRYPLFAMNKEDEDIRFDPEFQENYEAYVPDWFGCIPSDDAVRVGLPPNPQYDAILLGEAYGYPDTIKELLQMDIEESQKERLRKDLIEAEKKMAEQTAWDSKYEEYIELSKTKIFVALREGRLKAYGRPIPADGTDDKWSYWTDNKHEEIPATFWRLESIKWEQSTSENEKGHYCHICIQTDQLFEFFPEPDAEGTKTVCLVAGQYVMDESQVLPQLKIENRGRPALDWDAFHLVLTDRLMSNDLPEKQEAFIAEMQDWCFRNWNRKVARTTLLQKISPYYKRYVRK